MRLPTSGRPTGEVDEVHVSVAFTYDKAWAEQWRHVAPVQIGGVAYSDRGEEFVSGKYIKPGYVFTSRGCPRRCWFCSVWKRDPVPRLLPIVDGWNILDDNLLACPRSHVEAVFAMLRRQKRRVEFTGGLKALSLQDYQVDLLASLKPRPTMFFAYDPGDAFETLENAARRLLQAGFTRASHAMSVYVLVGYPKDTFTGRATLAADAYGRLHAPRHAVTAGDAIADEIRPGGKLARRSAAMGASGNNLRPRGRALRQVPGRAGAGEGGSRRAAGRRC